MANLLLLGSFNLGSLEGEFDTAASTGSIESTIEVLESWSSNDKYYKLNVGEILLTPVLTDPASNENVLGFWWRHNDDTSTTAVVCRCFGGSGDNWTLKYKYDGTGGRFELFDADGNSSGTSSGTFIAQNTWHAVEIIWVRKSGTSGSCTVKVNNTNRITDAGDNFTSGDTTFKYKWENNDLSAQEQYVRGVYVKSSETAGLGDDWHIIGPYTNDVGYDWKTATEVQAWEKCQEKPRDGVASCDISPVTAAYIGCSTWQGNNPGPRDTDDVNDATPVGAVWHFYPNSGSGTFVRGLYGKQTDASKTTKNTTIGGTLSVGVMNSILSLSSSSYPAFDEWLQIGFDGGGSRFHIGGDKQMDWCAGLVLVTGGSAPTTGKRASAGTHYGTSKEVLAA